MTSCGMEDNEKSKEVMIEEIRALAHDLNQPLNVTKIVCQSLLRDIQKNRSSEEETKESLTEIVTQMNRLAEMIGTLRTIARRPGEMPAEGTNKN